MEEGNASYCPQLINLTMQLNMEHCEANQAEKSLPISSLDCKMNRCDRIHPDLGESTRPLLMLLLGPIETSRPNLNERRPTTIVTHATYATH